MKSTIASILVAAALIGGAVIASKSNPSKTPPKNEERFVNVDNVRIENGIQYIDIRAKGGYRPRRSTAKAGIPTILRFDSKGTFDCSASVRIPSKNISQSLDFSGVTNIDIGTPVPGLMKGSCSMGMYPFEVDFQS